MQLKRRITNRNDLKEIPKNLCRILVLVFMHLWLHAIRLKSSYRKKSYETYKIYNIMQLSHKPHKFILVCKVKDRAVGRPENPEEMGE